VEVPRAAARRQPVGHHQRRGAMIDRAVAPKPARSAYTVAHYGRRNISFTTGLSCVPVTVLIQRGGP
jgi:hypothetical protein